MQLFSSLIRRMTGRPQNRGTPASKPVPRFRPQLEALEGRIVPSTLTVTNNANTGAGSLRTQINLAHSGDTIVFAPSMAGKTITSADLTISKNLTIQGPGESYLLMVSGGLVGNYGGLFEVLSDAHVAMSGLTVEYGRAVEGGGIYNAGTLTVLTAPSAATARTTSTASTPTAAATPSPNAETRRRLQRLGTEGGRRRQTHRQREIAGNSLNRANSSIPALRHSPLHDGRPVCRARPFQFSNPGIMSRYGNAAKVRSR
jgi:hypothetical protein